MNKNETLLRRLEQFDAHGFDNASVRFLDDNESMIPSHDPSSAGQTPSKGAAVLPTIGESMPLEGSFGSAPFPKEFETVLEQTRVYARSQSNDCDVSFTSSAIRTTAWSALSGLSLNDISVISVLALPISWEEVDKMGSHLTFAGVLSGVQPPGSAENLNPQTFSSSRPNAISSWPTRRELERQVLRRFAAILQSRSNPSTDKAPTTFLLHQIKSVAMQRYHLTILGDRDATRYQFASRIQPEVRSVFQPQNSMSHYLHLSQFCHERFSRASEPGVRSVFHEPRVIDGQSCDLIISLDRPTLKEYTALRERSIRHEVGFLLVYSVASRSSFEEIGEIHAEIMQNTALPESSLSCPDSPLPAMSSPLPILLVGNESDGDGEREVSIEEGRAYAKELGCEFLETSAKDRILVETALHNVVRMIRRQQQEQPLGRRRILTT